MSKLLLFYTIYITSVLFYHAIIDRMPKLTLMHIFEYILYMPLLVMKHS